MESNDAILTFDTLYTTNEIQILKLALPLLSPSLRPYIALLIKGKEMKYCMEQLPKAKMEHTALELDYLDVFLDSALPYCNDRQRSMFLQLKQLKQSLSMFEKMKGLMSVFDDDSFSDFGTLFEAFGRPDGFPGAFSEADSEKSSSPEDFLRSAMSPEQAEMFESFKKKFEEDSF
ncbi:MAG: hypothetical protein IJZ76_05075 [Lachnospiraceae bacterium]|nr:hypothetical protein [Lachnospiraceae bacterium]